MCSAYKLNKQGDNIQPWRTLFPIWNQSVVTRPVLNVGYESWTIKKTECWRIDAFELWCWRRLLRVSWTARRSNQSILKGINPEYSLEGLMLKLKLWWPDGKNWLTGKDPDAGKNWRQAEKQITEDEMVGWHHWFDGHEFEQAPGVDDGQGSLACCSPWDCWTELNWAELLIIKQHRSRPEGGAILDVSVERNPKQEPPSRTQSVLPNHDRQ